MMSRRRCTNLVLVASVAASVAAFAAPRRAASGKDDLPTLANKLAQCKQDLAEARAGVAAADQLLGLTRSKKVVLLPVLGVLLPVEAEQFSDFLILQTVTGKLTKDELRKQTLRFANAAKATDRLLNELGAEARVERDKIDGRCAQLAQDLKDAQPGQAQPGQAQPGQPVAGTFVLDPARTEVKNPNARELKIDAAAGTGTWTHCCDGGKWDAGYSFTVPETMTPGQNAKITIGLSIEKVTPSQRLLLGIKAFAPGLAKQLLVDYPAQGSGKEVYDVSISSGTKEVAITIELVSATVTYHYRQR